MNILQLLMKITTQLPSWNNLKTTRRIRDENCEDRCSLEADNIKYIKSAKISVKHNQ